MFEVNDLVKIVRDSEASSSDMESEVLGKVGRIARLYAKGNSYGFQYGVEIPALQAQYPGENTFGFSGDEAVLLAIGDKVITACDEGLDVTHLGSEGLVTAIDGTTVTVRFADDNVETLEYYHLDRVRK